MAARSRSSPEALFPDREAAGWDESPGGRIGWLAAACCLPLLVVSVRMALVQGAMAAREATEAVRPRVHVEAVDARDGAIRTRDGRTLAADVPAFSVAVDYRWIEAEADRDWLDGAARRAVREGRAETRAEARDRWRSERDAMWEELAALTGLGDRLASRRAAIEGRVTRIREEVAERLARRRAESAGEIAVGFWRGLFGSSDRGRDDRLVIAEELEGHEVATVGLEAAELIRNGPERFPGVRLRESRRRGYAAWGPTHLLGYRLVSREGDATAGAAGIERAFDRHLAGVPGERRVVTARDGSSRRVEEVRTALPGRDLTLTIDAGLQRDLAAACGRFVDRGAAVVLDVRTGAVRAAVSRPRFDPAAAGARDGEFWGRIAEEPGQPLFDRVTSGRYRPGAIVGSFLIATAYERGVIDDGFAFDCRGYHERPGTRECPCFATTGVGHGRTGAADAIAGPCHVTLYEVGERLGAEGVAEAYRRFGFGGRFGSDLSGVAAGRVPGAERLVGGRLLDASIGSGEVAVTPLEVARAAAAVANGGTLPTPHVVAGYGVREAGASAEVAVDGPTVAVGAGAAGFAWRGLRRGVEDPAGSAHAALSGLPVSAAGVTASVAADGLGRRDDWHVAVWPAERPEAVLVVVVEGAEDGVAANVGRAVLARRGPGLSL